MIQQLKGQAPHVLVVGDLILDHYLIGVTHRISPEAPVPVVDVRKESVTLGGAGNVLHNLQALGARVQVLAAVGDDPTGRELLGLLDRHGLPTGGVVSEPQRWTSRKTRVVAAQHQIVRFDKETTAAIGPQTEARLIERLEATPEPLAAILISDYNKGLVTPALSQAVVAYGRRRGIPVLVDPKGTQSQQVPRRHAADAQSQGGRRVDGAAARQRPGAAGRRAAAPPRAGPGLRGDHPGRGRAGDRGRRP